MPTPLQDWCWLPIGTIIPWAGTDITKIPSNWMLAMGTTFDRRAQGELFDAIGYSNGGSDPNPEFEGPDLRGRFVRGASEHGPLWPGCRFASKCSDGKFTIAISDIPTVDGWHPANSGGQDFMTNSNFSTTFKVVGSDSETRCNNIYMYWIIKVSDPTDKKWQDVPIGGMIPFAADKSKLPADCFPALIACEGGNVMTNKVPELAKALNGQYASDKINPEVTVVPDLRGLFIRGWAENVQQDPDFATRVPPPGYSGVDHNVVGSIQSWATRLPADAQISIECWNGNANATIGCAQQSTNATLIYDKLTTNCHSGGGGLESRPDNAALTWFISSLPPMSYDEIWTNPDPNNPKSKFPVGSVIAMPGSSTQGYLPSAKWILCDGTQYQIQDFPVLAKILGTTWGSARAGRFCVPNLQSQFIRGASLDDESPHPFDPEWNKRVAGAPGGNSSGVGSFQYHATGMPAHMTVDWMGKGNPSGVLNTAKDGQIGVSDPAPTAREFTVTGSFDPEMAPACVVVSYYIRAVEFKF